MGIIILVLASFGIYAILKKIVSVIKPKLVDKSVPKESAPCEQLVQPVVSQWAVYDTPSILRCGGKFPTLRQKKAGRSRKPRSFAVQ